VSSLLFTAISCVCRRRYLSAMVFAFVLVANPAAHADVVITTFDQVNAGNVWGPDKQVGVAVLVGSTLLNVSSVQMRQGNDVAPPSDEIFAIYARNADGTLGSVLFQDFTMSFSNNVETGTPNSPLQLGPNRGYWLVINSGPSDSLEVDNVRSKSYTAQAGISMPDPGDPVNLAIMVNDGTGPGYGPANFDANTDTGNPLPIFQINGTLAPEPTALSLAGVAGAILLTTRRKSRVRDRVS
jgi:hypothetical protein